MPTPHPLVPACWRSGGQAEAGARQVLGDVIDSPDTRLLPFPPADGRAVKRLTVFKPLFRVVEDDAGGDGEVVLLAFGIGKAQIYEAGFAFFNQFYCVFDRHFRLLNGK